MTRLMFILRSVLEVLRNTKYDKYDKIGVSNTTEITCYMDDGDSAMQSGAFNGPEDLKHHFRQLPHEYLLLPQDGEKHDLLLNLVDQPLALSALPITGVVLPVVKDSDFVLIDSCNGLLLYTDDAHIKNCNSPGFSIHDHYDDPYYICNPVTKNYIKLPNLVALLFEEDEKGTDTIENIDTRILFDPSVSLSYKVVRLLWINDTRVELYVYSSESGSWRFSTTVVYPDFNFSFVEIGVFLHGVMYWMTEGADFGVLCFDAEKNTVLFQPFPPPIPNPDFKRKIFYFGECGGRLILIEKYCDKLYPGCDFLTLNDGFDIMELTVENSRWTKKYHVNLEANRHLIGADIRVLHVYKTGNKFKEEEEAMLMKIDGRIVTFSLESNTLGKELTIPNSMHPFDYVDVHPYSIALCPL